MFYQKDFDLIFPRDLIIKQNQMLLLGNSATSKYKLICSGRTNAKAIFRHFPPPVRFLTLLTPSKRVKGAFFLTSTDLKMLRNGISKKVTN